MHQLGAVRSVFLTLKNPKGDRFIFNAQAIIN